MAAKNGLRTGCWASRELIAALPHGSPAWREYRVETRSSPSCCRPCITSTHNCSLMDAANTALCVCHGPRDLCDPWVKGTITHFYEQLPMTGLPDKAQRPFDEVNNLAPSIMTCHSQILMPFQGLLHQTNKIMNPCWWRQSSTNVKQKLNCSRERMSFKEDDGWGTFSYTSFRKHKAITHFQFLNNGYCLLGTYNLPHVVLGNFMHYFV